MRRWTPAGVLLIAVLVMGPNGCSSRSRLNITPGSVPYGSVKTFPYSIEVVYEATWEAVQELGLEISQSSPTYLVLHSTSLSGPLSQILVHLKSGGPQKTFLTISSADDPESTKVRGDLHFLLSKRLSSSTTEKPKKLKGWLDSFD